MQAEMAEPTAGGTAPPAPPGGKYLALARVSRCERRREGLTLEAVEAALRGYAEARGGQVVRHWRLGEGAGRAESRAAVRELVAYVRWHADELDGVLVFRLESAVRDPRAFAELAWLEAQHGVRLVSIDRPKENTPEARMHRRTLAAVAAFFAGAPADWHLGRDRLDWADER